MERALRFSPILMLLKNLGDKVMGARAFFSISILLCVAALGFFVQPAQAQNGWLYVEAKPREAYIFVDGKAFHESHYGVINVIKLPVGEHQVGIYNYGYEPAMQNVTVTKGKTAKIKAAL